jgi:hypothetical protein
MIRIDRAAKEIIEEYWDGDRTFCKKYAREESN